jgi:hypothetical protein
MRKQIIMTDLTFSEFPLQLPHIFTTNNSVRSHDSLVYTLSTESNKISLGALDSVIDDITFTLRTILNTVLNDPAKTMGLVLKLETAIRQRLEICVNIDVEDGLVNVTGEIVMAVTIIEGSVRPDYLWITFNHQSVGQLSRGKNKAVYLRGISADWTPMSCVKRQFKLKGANLLLLCDSNFQ